jgi:hypothetical protein
MQLRDIGHARIIKRAEHGTGQANTIAKLLNVMEGIAGFSNCVMRKILRRVYTQRQYANLLYETPFRIKPRQRGQ